MEYITAYILVFYQKMSKYGFSVAGRALAINS